MKALRACNRANESIIRIDGVLVSDIEKELYNKGLRKTKKKEPRWSK